MRAEDYDNLLDALLEQMNKEPSRLPAAPRGFCWRLTSILNEAGQLTVEYQFKRKGLPYDSCRVTPQEAKLQIGPRGKL